MSDCSHVSAAGVIVQWIPSKYGVMCRASCRLYTRYPSNEVFPVERMHLKHFIFDYVLHVRKDNLGRWAYVWKHVFLVKIKAVQYRDLELQFNEFSFSSYHFLYFCCCLIKFFPLFKKNCFWYLQQFGPFKSVKISFALFIECMICFYCVHKDWLGVFKLGKLTFMANEMAVCFQLYISLHLQ